MHMKTMPSDRSFGYFASAVAACASLYFFFTRPDSIVWLITLLIAILALTVALTAPQVLRPLNRAWLLTGELMGKVVSPLILSVIFFVLLTPIGLLSRLFGRDELRLRRQEGATCWIERVKGERSSDSFDNQF